jgi:hypothetical protein
MPAKAPPVGPSKHGNAPSLLMSLNRQEANGQRSIPARNASPELAPSENEQLSEATQNEDDDIYGPPLGSDDEEEGDIERMSQSSDEEEAGRGDIPPSNFKVKENICSSETRRSTTPDSFTQIRESHASARCSNQQAKSSPLRRSRREVNESPSNTPKKPRLETSSVYKSKESDIFNILGSQTRKKAFQQYGSQSRSQGSRGSQSNSESSPKAIFKKPPKGMPSATILKEDPYAKLQVVNFEVSNSPDKKFKLPEQVVLEEPEMEAGKTFKTFDIPVCSPDSSPYKKPQFKLGPDLNNLPEPEYDTPIFQTFDVMELLRHNTKDLIDRVPLRALENEEDAQSQPRIFQMPAMIPAVATDSQAEAGEAEGLDDSSFEISPPSPDIVPKAVCPMCGDSVDATFLRSYNGGKRMNIRSQTKFCRAHKKKSARNEWAEKGYPSIDWSDLDARLAQHHSYLKSLLDGASSYYRNILAKQVKSGKDRTLLQALSNSDNSLTPGYYGSRGFRAMSENIMDKFSAQLRRIAVTDRLVAARGVTGYVQTVLVPELAVRLIREDMGVGVEDARQVMRESVGIGDLLNEEVEDVVTWKEGDETL